MQCKSTGKPFKYFGCKRLILQVQKNMGNRHVRHRGSIRLDGCEAEMAKQSLTYIFLGRVVSPKRPRGPANYPGKTGPGRHEKSQAKSLTYGLSCSRVC